MSAASAPGLSSTFRPVPPLRGSFPVDHDGECTSIVKYYLDCIRKQGGTNADECRIFAKEYLECRMEKGLMDKDNLENLGLADLKDKKSNVDITGK